MTDTTAALAVPPAERERLTLDAIEAAEYVATGEWSIEDACTLVGRDQLVHGLLLYTQLMEVSVSILRGIPGQVEPVRQAARDTVVMWRQASR